MNRRIKQRRSRRGYGESESHLTSRMYREAQIHFEEAEFWATEGLAKTGPNCDEALSRLVKGSTALGSARALQQRDDGGVTQLRDRAAYAVATRCLVDRSRRHEPEPEFDTNAETAPRRAR